MVQLINVRIKTKYPRYRQMARRNNFDYLDDSHENSITPSRMSICFASEFLGSSTSFDFSKSPGYEASKNTFNRIAEEIVLRSRVSSQLSDSTIQKIAERQGVTSKRVKIIIEALKISQALNFDVKIN